MGDKLNWLNNLASGKIKYNLGAGVPPMNLYPEFHPGKLFGFEQTASNDVSINYHPTAGFIKEAAVKVLAQNEGLVADKDNIVITNGVQEAIALAVAAFKNNTLVCTEPSYPGFEDAVTTFGGRVRKLSPDNWLKELEELAPGNLFYVSADFSNPLGYSLTLEERKKLVNLAVKNKFFIFDDATYRPFNLDQPLPTLLSLNNEYVIHALSFSKILAPGLRTAFVYLPKTLTANFITYKSNLSLNNSGITQKIIENWLQQNNFHLSAHLGKAKARLTENRKVLEKHGIAYYGGFFCTLNIEPKADYAFCEALLKREQIAAIPMCLFSDNPKFERQLRLCLSNIEHEALDLVLNLIKNFVI